MTALACSNLSAALEEPLVATATPLRGYLLVERAAPWSRRAVDERLPAEVLRRAAELGVKPLLIRRHGRAATGDAVFLALDGQLERLPHGRIEPGAGEPVAGPLYLVCTNGQRDRCCAVHGTALARALAPELGARLWECSHLGGHRFAANLLCLPDGLLYGRLDADSGRRVVAAHAGGRVELGWLRGRSCRSRVAQAAEALVRRETGLLGLDDLALEREEGLAVRFATPQGRLEAALTREELEPVPASCGSEKLETPIRWALAGLRRLPDEDEPGEQEGADGGHRGDGR